MLATIRNNRMRNYWSDPFALLQRELGVPSRALPEWADGDWETVGNYPVDIHEDEDHVYVDAEMPGFKREEVQVTLEAGVLTLSAERKTEEVKADNSRLSERRYNKIWRSFNLPNTVDENKVHAHLQDGVLKLKIQKREEVKPRRIEVK